MELESFHRSGSRANGAEHTSTGETKSATRTWRKPTMCHSQCPSFPYKRQSPAPVCLIQSFPEFTQQKTTGNLHNKQAESQRSIVKHTRIKSEKNSKVKFKSFSPSCTIFSVLTSSIDVIHTQFKGNFSQFSQSQDRRPEGQNIDKTVDFPSVSSRLYLDHVSKG